jgi:integrase
MASLKKRGKTYYAQYYVGSRQRRVSLHTTSLQVAKEKIRQIESAQARGTDIPLPTRTPLAKVLKAYILNLNTVKTPRNVQRDIHYLRSTFGPICPEMELKNKKISQKGIKRPGKDYVPTIEVNFFEQITTFDIANFIASQVRSKGLAPKTANRYREILTRLYNWAMEQYGIRMPENKNPAAKVERYKEKAPNIRFLTLDQIDKQLKVLEDYKQLKVMVAMYIYAGLRREEALWLTINDVDLDAGTNGMIRIQAKTVNGEYWESKTQVNRVVPISTALRKYLDLYVTPESDQGWFFPSPKGARWDVNNFSQALSKANKANNLPWTCLDYRHTFGSQLAMKGESLYKISTLMGNSPEICRRHYAALIPEALADCVNF